jgi:hypothetical protein
MSHDLPLSALASRPRGAGPVHNTIPPSNLFFKIQLAPEIGKHVRRVVRLHELDWREEMRLPQLLHLLFSEH